MIKQNISTILAVGLTLFILVSVMMITLTATTEADDGFRTTKEEEQGMVEYYQQCPFKKAELDDLTDPKSVRDVVRFVSVECDPEKKFESVVVTLLGDDREAAQQRFERWLTAHKLQRSVQLQITFQN